MKKIKFRSAEEKRQYMENERSWKQIKAKYETNKRVVPSTDKILRYSLENPPGRDRLDIPSRSTSGGVASSRESMKYTGDMVKGISIVHKSCLQPVFTDQQAKDFAGMRR
jgi:hypothetical protein